MPNEKHEPLFSIIVPVYNVEKYVDKCLSHIQMQTFGDFEVIIVYGKSDDQSTRICESYCNRDNRFIMIEQHDKGLPNARNIAIKYAKGKYLIYVDSDDYISLDTCERFSKVVFEYTPEIIVGEATVEGKIQDSLCHTNLHENYIYTGEEYSIKAIERKEWFAPVWLNAYKKEFVLDNDLMFFPGIYHEDLQYQPRSFFAATNVCYMKGPFYHYLVREGSLSQEREHIQKERNDILLVLHQWEQRINQMEDGLLKRSFAGMLIKQFLYFYRTYGMDKGYSLDCVDIRYVLTYGLDTKEKIKGMLFCMFPSIYRRL